MAEIDVRRLTAAARALMLAGRWAQAAGLLEDASAASPAERAVLAVAQAEVAVDQDFWVRTNLGSSALERASTAAADAAADPSVGFDLEFLRLKHDYTGELFGAAGDAPRFGPQGRDVKVIDRLASRAASLRASAPDSERATAATFYAGLIEDNLRGDGDAARSIFASALTAAEEAGDDLTVSDALRHLGYHASEAGDAGQARQMWERSAEQRQRAGAVPYVLSQQLLLAGLARDTGDPDAARTVAREVGRWAHALGVTLLESQAAEIAGP
jgi:tetratricopeptide (TPR) repeat protein